jgi:anti-sigma regulatory factor (Ser/Thr protein kinase)
MTNHQDRQELAVVELPASMDSWDDLIGSIRHLIDQQLPESPKSYGLMLSAEELLSNMIREAGQAEDGSGAFVSIRIRCFLYPRLPTPHLDVEISDNGPYFDPKFDQLPSSMPDIPVRDRPVGGLGLFLVKSSVDKALYERVDDRNCYTLTTYLS